MVGERRQPGGLLEDLLLGRLQLGDDGRVVAADRADLVDLLEEIVEALGVDDDVDDVGRRGLVDGHQLVGQDPLVALDRGAEADEAGAGGPQPRLE